MDAAEYNAMVARDMLENVLQERVRQLLILHGWRHYHTYRSKRSPAGFPDECAVRGDRLLFAELKRERGKLCLEQLVDVGVQGRRVLQRRQRRGAHRGGHLRALTGQTERRALQDGPGEKARCLRAQHQ